MVTVIKDAVLSSAKDIIQFEIEQNPTTVLPLEVVINNAAHRIEIKYSNGANITEIKISKFAISPNATLKETIPSTIDLSASSPIFSVQAQDGSVQVWTMVGVNKGLSNKSKVVTLDYSDFLKKGYSFFDHTVIYDFDTKFSTDKSYIKVLDMQAIAFGSVIGGGPGAPAAFVNFQNFQSGRHQDGSYTNGTQFVKISPSVTFTTYDQIKEGYESSSQKVNAIGQYSIKVGDLYIAKIRGGDYYVLIQITQVVRRSDSDFSFTFNYTY
jgi:hypothetical protein